MLANPATTRTTKSCVWSQSAFSLNFRVHIHRYTCKKSWKVPAKPVTDASLHGIECLHKPLRVMLLSLLFIMPAYRSSQDSCLGPLCSSLWIGFSRTSPMCYSCKGQNPLKTYSQNHPILRQLILDCSFITKQTGNYKTYSAVLHSWSAYDTV